MWYSTTKKYFGLALQVSAGFRVFIALIRPSLDLNSQTAELNYVSLRQQLKCARIRVEWKSNKSRTNPLKTGTTTEEVWEKFCIAQEKFFRLMFFLFLFLGLFVRFRRKWLTSVTGVTVNHVQVFRNYLFFMVEIGLVDIDRHFDHVSCITFHR